MNQSQESALIAIGGDETRIVTPGDPLFVNSDPANFGAVQIAGGDIVVQVKSTVKFASLEKTS